MDTQGPDVCPKGTRSGVAFPVVPVFFSRLDLDLSATATPTTIATTIPMTPVTWMLSVKNAIGDPSSSSPFPSLLPSLSPFIRREPNSFSDFTMFPWEGLYQKVVVSPSSTALTSKLFIRCGMFFSLPCGRRIIYSAAQPAISDRQRRGPAF